MHTYACVSMLMRATIILLPPCSLPPQLKILYETLLFITSKPFLSFWSCVTLIVYPLFHIHQHIIMHVTAIEPVWKVARYTSAAPVFFKEFENYVDGGVLANNPCDYGLTAIQNYYRQQGIDLPIALVVSVGTGIYPSEELGRIDAQEFLFFGKHWFNATDTIRKRTRNLIQLLSNAVSYCVAIMSIC